MPKYCVYEGEECRLDKALGDILPELGLRGRRRMIENNSVLVHGIARKAAFVVRAGAVITLLEQPADTAPQLSSAHAGRSTGLPAALPPSIGGNARALERQGDFIFFCKPAAMHSVHLAGSAETSLETLLPSLAASLPQANTAQPEDLHLVQRLDYGTSGIVAAAAKPLAALHWRDMEDRGLCCKRYLALVCGALDTDITATAELDMAKRRHTKVLPSQAPALRHTQFTPLAQLLPQEYAPLCALAYPQGSVPSANSLSLVGCTIHKGARHQIRAHAAAAGFPLWGDALYGGGEGFFFLHHGALDSPLCSVRLAPAWLNLLPFPLARIAEQWLMQKEHTQT
jgi:23S rRNA pseudouridine1911/1915/1917 synthase